MLLLLSSLLTPENDDIREVWKNIWNDKAGHFHDMKVVPIESCWVVYDCKLGRQTYTKQKKVLENAGFGILRRWDHLREKQKEITPVVKHLPAPFIGVFFPLSKAVEMTISRHGLLKYIE